MPALAEAKPVHARWSEVNREFLDFVERNPECLDRASFGALDQISSALRQPVQPWPLFADGARWRSMADLTLGMDRLVKGVVERFLENDPARVVEFYRTRGTPEAPAAGFVLTEEMLALLADEPSGIWSAPSRADYIETPSGLQCIEFNSGGFLGGLQTQAIGELYLQSPPTARFLLQANRRARSPGVLRALFRHVVEDTADLGIWQSGDFNVAMVVRPHEPGWVARHSADAYTRELLGVLESLGMPPRGRVLLCSLEELVSDGGGLGLEGHRVHAVVEQHNGEGDLRHTFRAFKLGLVNLFSGPIGEVLSDKRNLVLLSEHAASDEFTAEERTLIEEHLPWTRSVLPACTTFRGRPLRIPDDLPAHRDGLVLKKASSVGGDFVEVGRFRTADEWARSVERALLEEDWVVQEYLETVPFWFQSDGEGAARHELVWGLFAFGDHFGGAFLRMHPAGRHDGVVNTRRGSAVGTVLELVD